jgi:hypothetical protein
MYYLIKKFREQQRLIAGVADSTPSRRGPRLYASLRSTTLLVIIKVVCPTKLKCLAALDPCSEIHRRLNFVKMRQMLTAAAEMVPMEMDIRCEDLIKESRRVEDFAGETVFHFT